jgi:hypothetical protein
LKQIWRTREITEIITLSSIFIITIIIMTQHIFVISTTIKLRKAKLLLWKR